MWERQGDNLNTRKTASIISNTLGKAVATRRGYRSGPCEGPLATRL